jgi:23S rRNA (uridine2552-2'-O)-methyltransferase
VLPTDPVPGAEILHLDFLDSAAPERLKAALAGPADAVLSDMAAPATGHAATDHLRIVALAETAFAFAQEVLAPGGTFVCKVFQGGTEGDLLAQLKRAFASVRHAKPPASRADSAETYVVATGFRGS